MNNNHYNVLVTGVGAIIGYGIVRSLKQSKKKTKIIGIDIFNDAVGKNWCDVFFQGKYANDEGFYDFVNNIIHEEQIDLVIPGIEQDLEAFISDERFLNIRKKIPFVLNNVKMYPIMNDKRETQAVLKSNGIDTIPSVEISGKTYNELIQLLGSPFILKETKSYAAKGVKLIEQSIDYEYWIRKLKDCMAQKVVGDGNSEYTVSVFGLENGQYSNEIILKRKLARDGYTIKAQYIKDEKISDFIKIICKLFEPVGPTNIQLIKDTEKIYLLEINPRLSSSTSIREAMGVNESEMCIEYFIEKKTPYVRSIKAGTAIRYIEDLVHYDSSNF